jgi:hypothetical protein
MLNQAFLIKGKQSGSVGNAFLMQNKSLFIQEK